MQTINENYSGDMPEEEKTVQTYCEESTTALGNLQLFATQNCNILLNSCLNRGGQ
jgi:hypothetical protein